MQPNDDKLTRVILWVTAILLVVFIFAYTIKVNATHNANHNPPKKYFVCKYVGKPGVNETLQTGQNPISVNENALTPPVVVGASFNDAQGRSVVVALDSGQEKPSCVIPTNNPCPHDSTLVATDSKCVAPKDPIDPTDPVTPVVTTTKRAATAEVFVGK